MEYKYSKIRSKVHRLIPSRFPPVNIFDWAQTKEEVEEIADLEGLTNNRLVNDRGSIYLVPKCDWICGDGASLLMAPFTHPGESRFSDGTFGIYYAGDSLDTAVAETKFHRERFLSASKEAPCRITMRELTSTIQKKLVDLTDAEFQKYLNPDPKLYQESQTFGFEIRSKNEWGLLYPSVRKMNAKCVAIFRPPAITIPVQGCHLDYIWDGQAITEILQSKPLN